MNISPRLCGSTALALLLGLPGSAFAQDSQPVQLPAISVAGDWLGEADEELVRTHPGGRGAVRQEQFEPSGAATVTEAIRAIPGVQTPPNNGTGSGDYALNIGIRGMTARLSAGATILLDGVPLANAPYGQPETSLAPVSLGMLQAIDVVKGGGAVRYGPNTSGGVVNFVTKDIPSTPFGGEIGLRGDSSALADADGRRSGKLDLLFGGSLESGTGLAVLYGGNHGDGFRDNHRQDIDDLMLKGRLALTEASRLEARLHGYEADSNLPGPLSQADFSADPFQSTHSYERFRGDRDEAVLKYVNEFDGDYRLEATGFYTESFRQFTLANGSDTALTRLDRFPRHYRVFGFEPRFSAFASTGNIEHAMSVGYRYMNEDTNEKLFRRTGFGTGGNPFSVNEALNRNTDGSTDAHAVFVDDAIKLGAVTVTPGLRVEQVEVERVNLLTDYRDSEDYREPLPSLNVGWQVNPALFTYVNYSTSFNPVTHLALASSGTETSLEPERAKTYEVGTRYQVDGLRLEAGLFWIDFDNQIESVNGVNINTGATRHRGLELAGEYDLGRWNTAMQGLSIYGTYTYTDAERMEGDNKGNALQLYSPHVANLGARYRLDDWTFNLNAYGQSQQYADDANTTEASANGKLGIIPGYVIWNSQVAYQGADGATVAVGVNNIFDRRYYTRAAVENNGGIFVGAPRMAYIQTKFAF